jgi:ABC-type transport system involved in cytochrome c biogenesis permease component
MHKALQLIVMLTANGKKFDILVSILMFPFINPILRDLSFGTTHFNLEFIGVGILFVLIVILETVDETWTVGL